jgi:hypothetical protein
MSCFLSARRLKQGAYDYFRRPRSLSAGALWSLRDRTAQERAGKRWRNSPRSREISCGQLIGGAGDHRRSQNREVHDESPTALGHGTLASVRLGKGDSLAACPNGGSAGLARRAEL